MKITTIGGGTGQFHLLQALKLIPNLDLTAIVTMADSGGSSGRLRDEFGVLPPGDILQCILALSRLPRALGIRQILRKKIKQGPLRGHNAGNLLLTILAQYSGSFLEAIRALSEILEVKGKVLPATINHVILHGSSKYGREIHGEAEFDRLGEILERDDIIEKVWLKPDGIMLKEVGRSLNQADFIILGPGDLYSSIIPVLLIRGVKESLINSKAPIIYVCNIMTKRGQTDNFKVSDFVKTIEVYLGKKLDKIIANNEKINVERIKKYKKEGSELVIPDLDDDRRVITAPLISTGNLVRHDPIKLAEVLKKVITQTLEIEK